MTVQIEFRKMIKFNQNSINMCVFSNDQIYVPKSKKGKNRKNLPLKPPPIITDYERALIYQDDER